MIKKEPTETTMEDQLLPTGYQTPTLNVPAPGLGSPLSLIPPHNHQLPFKVNCLKDSHLSNGDNGGSDSTIISIAAVVGHAHLPPSDNQVQGHPGLSHDSIH